MGSGEETELRHFQISGPAAQTPRLLGSHPAGIRVQEFLQRPPQPNGPPEPPPPAPLPVSAPDLGAQFSPCLPDTLRNPLIGAIRDAVGQNADVRTACVGGTQRVGIWLLPSGNSEVNAARDRGLQGLNILGNQETFAFFVNSGLIRQKANEAWNSMPKRLNGEGNPDPNGPIHLTSLTLSFDSPDSVVTRIGGFDERPWPDVDFTLSITDRLSVSADQIQCQSGSQLDVDTSWLNVLTGIFLALGAIVSPLFFIPAGVFTVELIVIGSIDAPAGPAGAGCAAAMLLPREILIPAGLKLVPLYRRVDVGAGGIFAGGSYVVVARQPSASVSGPAQIATTPVTTVQRTYRASALDDLRPPFTYLWTADGTVANSDQAATIVRFNVKGAGVGDILTRRVALRIVDADSLAATADETIRIHIVEEDTDPPVCRTKPWLPQCQ
jgi:hypothetical protein